MSHHAKGHGVPHHRPFVAPLRPRSPEEEHRASSPLELFFDLVIVVAVAQAASGLHHALSEGHFGAGVLMYSTAKSLLPTIVGGLLIVFSFWWLYFERPAHEVLTSVRSAFVWGYGHYFVLAAAAAVGAGLAVAVDHVTHHAEISEAAAGAAVAVPVAVYLLCLWFLHARSERSATRVVAPLVVAGVILTPFTGEAVLWTGLLMAGLTAFKVVVGARPELAPKEAS